LFAIPLVWGSALVVGYVPALWMLTGTGLVLTVAGLGRPPVGLLGVAILACLDAPSRVFLFTGGPFRWNTVAYLLLVAAVVFFRDLRRLRSLQGFLLVSFALFLVCELLWSPDKASGMEHLVGLSAVFGMAGFCLRGGATEENWLWIARVANVLAAAGGPVYFLLRRDLLYINPNAWAYLPVAALLLAGVASTVAPAGERRGLLLPLCVAANLAWIFLSGSRGSFVVGLVAVGLFVWMWKGRRGASLAIVSVVLIAIVGTGLFSDLQSGMAERLGKTFEDERSLSNRTSGRSDLVIVGWRMFLDNPMGVGTGGFMAVARGYGWVGNLAVFRTHEELQAHSAWIKTLAENGVPGILLFGGFVASFAVVGWRRRAQGVATLGFAVSAILAIAFVSTEFQSKGVWLFAAAGLVVVRLWKRSDQSSRPPYSPSTAGGRAA
jgi:O-antigen ligase